MRVYVCTRVQALSCNTSTCIKVLLHVLLCVFRLPPSGSCIYPAKTRDGCGIFAHLLPRLVLYNPGNEALRALNTSHPMQQAESPADPNDLVCSFNLLLPDLGLYAQFLVSVPGLYCLQLFQVCCWLPLPKWSSTEKYLVPKDGPTSHNFLPFFISLF